MLDTTCPMPGHTPRCWHPTPPQAGPTTTTLYPGRAGPRLPGRLTPPPHPTPQPHLLTHPPAWRHPYLRCCTATGPRTPTWGTYPAALCYRYCPTPHPPHLTTPHTHPALPRWGTHTHLDCTHRTHIQEGLPHPQDYRQLHPVHTLWTLPWDWAPLFAPPFTATFGLQPHPTLRVGRWTVPQDYATITFPVPG